MSKEPTRREFIKTTSLAVLAMGMVESGTGFIDLLYLGGHQVISNRTVEELTEITCKVNANGLTMHMESWKLQSRAFINLNIQKLDGRKNLSLVSKPFNL